MEYDVKDMKLADQGKLKIEWAEATMPVLRLIKKRFQKEKPFKGLRMTACLHVTTETANLMKTLQSGGADVRLCASNPLSTQDEIAAALVKHDGIPTFAIKGEDNKTYYKHIQSAIAHKPQITMDDGADVVSLIHSKRKDLLKHVIGGTEETTTGVIRLRSMAEKESAEVSGDFRERRRHQAPVRQPLWDRPEHDRRHHPRDEPIDLRHQLRGRRLWLVRARDRDARQGHGRRRHRDRDRSGQGD